MALTALHLAALWLHPKDPFTKRRLHYLDARPKCFFDISLNGISKGRVVFQLHSDTLPRTSRNFVSLCMGNRSDAIGQPLHYKGTLFHGIYPKQGILVGGDIRNGNGTGGESIYGPSFSNEKHSSGFERPGTLAMLNWGPNVNHSQFFISLDKQDKDAYPTNVAFGHVISGLDILNELRHLGDKSGYPTASIRIQNCGRI